MNSKRASALVLGIAVTALWPARLVAQTCPGDCNDDKRVMVNELVLGVNIALERADASACSAVDTNHNLRVTVDELVAAVGNALNNCPTITTTPTPTATATPLAPTVPGSTPTPTATVVTGNAPPHAVDDAVATLVAEAIPIAVLANDSDPNADLLTITDFTQPAHGTISFTNTVATYAPNGGFSGTDSFSYTISDGRGGIATATVTIGVHSAAPDPATTASPPTNGVATIVDDATRFLYTGADATQFGVIPDTIERVRAAVVRGKVETRDGTPLAGVRITVLGHPELGFTAARADGMFDMAVNGGGTVTINYEKPGFCPVQRTISVPWQDYVMAPDVVMVQLDPMVTTVALDTDSAMQVHQASMQSDASGNRKATLLFPPGTNANLVMPDGSMHAVSSLSVRATEFTVGASGPAAMPADLPPASAYTYCVELSADEAMNAGAMMVAFNQPVINYVENFLNFPVGIGVPTGFYDRQKAAWIPLPNGRVIKILSITGELANVDTDGDGVADTGLGITDEERQNLATLYAAGQTLWRTPIPHFTVVDNNFGFLTADARTPGQLGAGPDNDNPLQDPCLSSGSIIECENQVLGQRLPIVGTPYSLNYRSDREPGRLDEQRFTLIGTTVPASLAFIDLHIAVGGRTFDQTFAPSPNQRFDFVWDRQDAYGRTLQGGQPLTGSIDYGYPVDYTKPNTEAAFGTAGGAVLLEQSGRAPFIVSQPFSTTIGEGLTDARVVGLGGWTLSVHHFFDPVARVVHYGDGRRQRADSLTKVIETAVRGPKRPLTGSVGSGLTVGPDGSIYFMRSANDRVTSFTLRRLAPDGTETIVAGGGNQVPPPFGDDGPAVGAFLSESPIALGPDGSIYVFTDGAIRRIGRDGIIRRVVGRYFRNDGLTACNVLGAGPVGVPATDTDLCIGTFTVGPDGSLHLTDGNPAGRVLRVGPDGIITTIAGSSTQTCDTFNDRVCGDGGPASAALFAGLGALAVAPDGSLYVADGGSRIRRIGTDGIINAFAGGFNTSFGGDGGQAINAAFNNPSSLAFGADGSLYVADLVNARIRRVGTDGIITTVAGSGSSAINGDGGSALQAGLGFPESVVVAPDGTILLHTGAFGDIRNRRIGVAIPGISATDITIASQDGSELYIFDGTGRHLRTLDALTGAALFEFGYDANGLLSQVTEKTGGIDNVTTIEHDGAGNPTAIIGPFGQITTLAVDANGFLKSVSNPASEAVQMSSDANGLMATYADPRGKTSTFAYDSVGRLTLDAAPVGATQTLARVEDLSGPTNSITVTRTTALGRPTTYRTENLAGNVQRRTVTVPDGSESQSTENIDSAMTHVTSTDGMTSDTSLSPDPRFGIESPAIGSVSLHFPSGIQVDASSTRSAVSADLSDPLSLVSLTETSTVDGRTSSNTYTAATRTYVNTTPAGRVQTVTLDALGRVVQRRLGNLDPSDVAYDERGRLASLSIGSGANLRRVLFSYNAQGFLETVTDAIGRTIHLAYDSAGRILSKTLPDGRVIQSGFDAAGNITSLTPPGRPAHALSYSDRGELTTITPPAVSGSGPTTLAYDDDRGLITVSRPDNQHMAIGYDTAGRQQTRVLATGGVTDAMDTVDYDAAGRVSSITTASGVATNYAYDGPLINSESWTGPIAGAVTTSLDAGLRLASQSVNGTNSVTFSYDDDDLLVGVGALTVSRDAQHGLRTGSGLGTVSTALGYNSFGEVTSYTATASGAPLLSLSFVRDGLGRISQKTETTGGLTSIFDYSYDPTGQVSNVMRNGTIVESYSYDGNGNRTNASVGSTEITASYDDQDRLTQYDGSVYTYNGAGDLRTKTTGGQTTAYTYDQVGNLLGGTLPGGTTITYIIDGLDRRIGKKVNGTLVQGFLYGDTLRPVAELDGAGTVISRFVYASGNVPAYMVKGGDSFRLITDNVGSVRLVVNAATGAVVQRMDYDTFGNVLQDTNPGFQPFGFAGGIYDPDTTLVRLGARDYDAVTGRWTAKDPISFGGGESNLYRYAHNDPVNLTDPTGMGEVSQLDAEIAREQEFLQSLTGPGGIVQPPTTGKTLNVAEQEQFLIDWRVKREMAALSEARLVELRAARGRLQRILRKYGRKLGPGVTFGLVAISCYGLSARAHEAGVTPVQQFDNEGRRDLEADIQDVKEYFVEPIVDFVASAFGNILQ